MNGPDVLSAARRELAEVCSNATQPPPALNVSPWVAMSLLQKAVRRGREDLALQAAATLLRDSPERFWRRCCCIAFEDVGLASIQALSLAVAALTGKRFRSSLGGEWSVARTVVLSLAQSAKCRAADDLLMAAELHPAFQMERETFAVMGARELLKIATRGRALPIRALALWYAIGTDHRPSPRLRFRKGEPHAAFDYLCEAGYPHSLVEIAREGFRKTREVLGPLVVLLTDPNRSQSQELFDDTMPPEIQLRGVPGWAYDLYSREGRQSLSTFLATHSKSGKWLRSHVPPAKRVQLFGAAVFRVEGGLVAGRSRWPAGDELRRLVDQECYGRHCPNGSELLELVRNDISLLNKVRQNVHP